MPNLKRLEEIAEQFRGQLHELVVKENLLNSGEMIRLSVSIESAPKVVYCVINDCTKTVDPSDEILKKPLTDLGLSCRARKACRRLFSDNTQPLTIGALIQKSADDLRHVKNCGTVTIAEIREKLAGEYNLKLRGD